MSATTEAAALARDAADPLRGYRDRFHLPRRPDGQPVIYFCGHSLGLQPKAARQAIDDELTAWAERGIDGYFAGPTAWYHYQQWLRPGLARLVGAGPAEVIAMNGLTVNLHFLLASFYRPQNGRHKILIEDPAFPSDLYAVQAQLRHHGHDPATALITVTPRTGEHTLRTADVEATLERHGPEIAVVLLGGVNWFTGQVLDAARITAAAHRQGCLVSLDLAHAIGNVPLDLHGWGVDFAAWCHYKYLCAGPGAVAGAFVHHRHGNDSALPRWAGWWGNDPATRFRMHLQPAFVPHPGADGWQVSCPPILGLAPLRAALALYDEAGMPALRAKSVALTGYLLELLDGLPAGRFEVITPREPAARGCQVSLLVHDRAEELFRALEAAGVVGDFRPPNVIRVAPKPLYNTFHEVWRFVQVLAGL
jgi:kynureninase